MLIADGLRVSWVDTLTGPTWGVMTSASLAVAVIARAPAPERGMVTKLAIKRVDWLLRKHEVTANFHVITPTGFRIIADYRVNRDTIGEVTTQVGRALTPPECLPTGAPVQQSGSAAYSSPACARSKEPSV
jgi:hypothetical protein